MSTETQVQVQVQAQGTVQRYVFWSMGAGLIPVPVADMVALLAIQVKMVSDLSGQYGLLFSKSAGKSFIASLVGGTLPVAVAPTIASGVKAIPLVGTALGAVTMPVLAGASTYAVGKVFIQHFESGGTFLDFDPDEVRSYYAEQFEEGKARAKK